MATGVIGDAVREDGSEVCNAKAFRKKLGEFVDPRKKRINLCYESRVFARGFQLAGHGRIVLAHVSNAA